MIKYNNYLDIQVSMGQIPVVFLHAFPVNQKMWELQTDALQEAGIPCLTLDYPGFGASRLIDEIEEIDDYGTAVKSVIQELHITKAIFVGLSMGGYIALALFRNSPQLFHGLVLADTRASADTDETRQKRFGMIEQLNSSGDASFIFEQHIGKFLTEETRQRTPELEKQIMALMNESSNDGIRSALKAMAGRPDSRPLLKEMGFPVLILTGEKDELTSPAEAEEMASLCPDTTMHLIPDAAHLSNMENPAEFNRHLLGYVRRVI